MGLKMASSVRCDRLVAMLFLSSEWRSGRMADQSGLDWATSEVRVDDCVLLGW